MTLHSNFSIENFKFLMTHLVFFYRYILVWRLGRRPQAPLKFSRAPWTLSPENNTHAKVLWSVLGDYGFSCFISPKITLYSLIKSYAVPMGHPDAIISHIRLSCEINSNIYVLYAFNKLFIYLSPYLLHCIMIV